MNDLSRVLVRGRRRAIALLFAQYKKERYEKKGKIAFIVEGFFPSDDLYEVYAITKPKSHCDFIT